MAKLMINFDYYLTKDDGYTDYGDRQLASELLVLTALAAETYVRGGANDITPPANATWGRWSSTSRFLGKESSGKYYLTRLNFPEPGRWKELENPVALFFDSTSQTNPFLTLYRFLPDIRPIEGKSGKLENRAPVPMDRWVNWYPRDD